MSPRAARAPRHAAAGARRRSNGVPASSQRRAEIVDIAARLFAEKGFLATTIRDIADDAEILSGSLYHHFASKESLADEILSAYWTELEERYAEALATNDRPIDALRELILQSVRLLDSYELALRTMLNDWSYLVTVLPYLKDRMTQVSEVWTRVLRDGVVSGDFRPELDPQMAYRTIMSSISGTARWFRPGGSITVDQLATSMADVFLNGVQHSPSDQPTTRMRAKSPAARRKS